MPIPLILRAQKGAALTFDEVDGNFVAIADAADSIKEAVVAMQDAKGSPNGFAELDASGKLAQRSKVAEGTAALAVRDASGGAGKSAVMVASLNAVPATNAIVVKTGIWQSNADATCQFRGAIQGAKLNMALDLTLQLKSRAPSADLFAYTNNGMEAVVVQGAKHPDGYYCWILTPAAGRTWIYTSMCEILSTAVRGSNITDASATAWSIIFPTASELAGYTNVTPAVEESWALTPNDVNVPGGVMGLNTGSRGTKALEIPATAIGGNYGRVFVAPAAAHSNASLVAGCWVIKLSNVAAMQSLRARAYQYGTGVTRGLVSFETMLYHTNGQAAGTWSSQYLSHQGTLALPVRHANENSTNRRCVILGDVGYSWVYPALAVLDVATHRSTVSSDGIESVDVEFVTSLDNYNSISLVPDTGPYATAALAPTSLQDRGELPANTDMDAVLLPGRYRIRTNVNAATFTKLPYPYAGIVDVYLRGTASEVVQDYTSYTGNEKATRAVPAAAWNKWVRESGATFTGAVSSNSSISTTAQISAATIATTGQISGVNLYSIQDANIRTSVFPGQLSIKHSGHGGIVDFGTSGSTDYDWRLINTSSGTSLGALTFAPRSGAEVRFTSDGNIYSTRLGSMLPAIGYYVADAIVSLNAAINAIKARTDGGNGLVHTLTPNTIDQYWNGSGVVVRIDGNGATDRRFWDTVSLPSPASTATTNDLYSLVGQRVKSDQLNYAGFFSNDKLRAYFQHNDGTYVELPTASGVRRVAHGGSYVEILASDSVARGVSYNVSDRNKKKNIKPSTASALGVIDLFRFFSFFYRADSGMDPTLEYSIGAMAQDLEAIDSTFVQTLSDGTKMPVTMPLLMLALKANQELNEKLRVLTQRVEELERRNG